MDNSYKNSKYNIWFYNLSDEEKKILTNYLPAEHFNITDVENDAGRFMDIQNYNLLDKPDIVICDISTNINSELKKIIYDSYCSLAKVTLNKIDEPFNNTFELTNEQFDIISKVNGQYVQKTITKLENSINKIIEMSQISNIEKLQQITKSRSNVVLEEIKNNNEISKEYLFKMVKVFNDFISFKDNYTAGHCERVATYAEALGIALNMDNETLEDLILAAYLHDIGKFALPDAVIKKSSGLNDLEYNIMKKHVELGTSILPDNKFEYLKSAIRGHHEKYDGSGYPDGLKGNNIPLFAQILAIADSFDAMTSQRSYNKVKSAEEAFKDLERHSKPIGVEDGQGLFYNPELVKKFINIMQQSHSIMEQLAKNKEIADLRTQSFELHQNLQKITVDSYKDNGGKNYA